MPTGERSAANTYPIEQYLVTCLYHSHYCGCIVVHGIIQAMLEERVPGRALSSFFPLDHDEISMEATPALGAGYEKEGVCGFLFPTLPL